jgi:predicted homoserine dehydrogenase-like protein
MTTFRPGQPVTVGIIGAGRMGSSPAIDAVVIVTPARTHAGLVEAAGRAGKAVYRR